MLYLEFPKGNSWSLVVDAKASLTSCHYNSGKNSNMIPKKTTVDHMILHSALGIWPETGSLYSMLITRFVLLTKHKITLLTTHIFLSAPAADLGLMLCQKMLLFHSRRNKNLQLICVSAGWARGFLSSQGHQWPKIERQWYSFQLCLKSVNFNFVI